MFRFKWGWEQKDEKMLFDIERSFRSALKTKCNFPSKKSAWEKDTIRSRRLSAATGPANRYRDASYF